MAKPIAGFADYAATVTIASLNGAATGSDEQELLYPREVGHWTPPSASSQEITFTDASNNIQADTLFILADGLDGANLEVRGSTDGFVASDVQLGTLNGFDCPVNAGFFNFDATPQTYRDFKLVLTGHTTSARIFHLAWVAKLDLPFLEEDWDEDAFEVENTVQQSASGLFVGTVHHSTLQDIRLKFGDVVDADYADLLSLVTGTIKKSKPFFFVPDADETTCQFCFSDSSRFSAPIRTSGARIVAPIRVTTRKA